MSNRLYRSEKDRMIGGVCSGVAAHLNLDPVLVRLGFVLLTLFKGVGLLLYVLLLFLMPLNPDEDVEES
ncbi:MAG: PspC domain-containing protein [Chloroflexota bacterium]